MGVFCSHPSLNFFFWQMHSLFKTDPLFLSSARMKIETVGDLSTACAMARSRPPHSLSRASFTHALTKLSKTSRVQVTMLRQINNPKNVRNHSPKKSLSVMGNCLFQLFINKAVTCICDLCFVAASSLVTIQQIASGQEYQVLIPFSEERCTFS